RPGWEGLRETGADNVEFLLAANPGQPPRSLARTASGGELSRVLLAIKCALAGIGGRETLVFDEIDAGVGGRTAVAVGRKLRELATTTQVLVVTHLAPVAAVADRHYLIEKEVRDTATVTWLSELSDEGVVEELCRMMGGRPDDAEAMAHARELRDRAAGGLLD
ncbi:MAG: DNA repair protein RecN, partial [Thermoleophilia bacterium]|nr:DNA repair protein RecN [Thermoleophilia bacterium]